ncbi:acyl-CoA N-acyltransferase [Lentinus tigrinus ALCF2SS1-7]|uniref:acyl-CoA N-acyltransferase n=1 Tax=Lentinus tigrinus ALCF2SS1-7 TaxID=1328758 RepID=UPI001165F94E|nr:acyl-CoA N-acyltransferase [Lentinus tigrinus ALCF2SS1-7]
MTTSKVLKQANKASAKEIAEVAQLGTDGLTLEDTKFYTRVANPSSLSESDRQDIWNIFETNMRSLTERSSLGWDPKEKKEELFHRDSRFILVGHGDQNSSQKALVAYTMFRFEVGYEEDPSVYCYELQVCDGFRGLGLGRFLVDKLAIIGKHWHMEKILLTVLKENIAAREAYHKLGFQLDPNSPDYPDSSGEEEDTGAEAEEADYEILSREL